MYRGTILLTILLFAGVIFEANAGGKKRKISNTNFSFFTVIRIKVILKSSKSTKKTQFVDYDYCNTELYGEEQTMCKYTEDEPNARCKEGGVEIISRKVTDQVKALVFQRRA